LLQRRQRDNPPPLRTTPQVNQVASRHPSRLIHKNRRRNPPQNPLRDLHIRQLCDRVQARLRSCPWRLPPSRQVSPRDSLLDNLLAGQPASRAALHRTPHHSHPDSLRDSPLDSRPHGQRRSRPLIPLGSPCTVPRRCRLPVSPSGTPRRNPAHALPVNQVRGPPRSPRSPGVLPHTQRDSPPAGRPRNRHPLRQGRRQDSPRRDRRCPPRNPPADLPGSQLPSRRGSPPRSHRADRRRNHLLNRRRNPRRRPASLQVRPPRLPPASRPPGPLYRFSPAASLRGSRAHCLLDSQRALPPAFPRAPSSRPAGPALCLQEVPRRGPASTADSPSPSSPPHSSKPSTCPVPFSLSPTLRPHAIRCRFA
jgi:hypothetical protein